MDLNTFCQTVGVVGYLIYMFSFLALQCGKLDGNGNTYTLIVIIAAFCVLVGLTAAFNLASALIQISWIIIGFAGVLRRTVFRVRREPSQDIAPGVAYSPVSRSPGAIVSKDFARRPAPSYPSIDPPLPWDQIGGCPGRCPAWRSCTKMNSR